MPRCHPPRAGATSSAMRFHGWTTGLGAAVALACSEANGMGVRRHTLVWGTSKGPQGWLAGRLAAAPDPADLLHDLMNAHVATVASRWAGRIESWDVVNEPLATTSGAFDPSNLFLRATSASRTSATPSARRVAGPRAPAARRTRQPLFEFFAPNRPLLFDEALAAKLAHEAAVATLLAVPEPHSATALTLGLTLLGPVRRGWHASITSEPAEGLLK